MGSVSRGKELEATVAKFFWSSGGIVWDKAVAQSASVEWSKWLVVALLLLLEDELLSGREDRRQEVDGGGIVITVRDLDIIVTRKASRMRLRSKDGL